jgi:hypothetical protein
MKSCDLCRKDKVTCPGRPGTVKVAKGKKRQRTAGSPSPKAAVDRMCNRLNLFLHQQREFQAMFLGGLRMGLQTESDEVRKSSDVEKEDEEMNKEDGSEEEASGGTDESMDM